MVTSNLSVCLLLFIFHTIHGANQIKIKQSIDESRKIHQLPHGAKNNKIIEKEKTNHKNMVISDVSNTKISEKDKTYLKHISDVEKKNISEKETTHKKNTDVIVETEITNDDFMTTMDTELESIYQLPTVNQTTEATTVNKILLVYRPIAQCSPSPQYHQTITSIHLPHIDLSWKEYVEEVYNQHNQSIFSKYIPVIYVI